MIWSRGPHLSPMRLQRPQKRAAFWGPAKGTTALVAQAVNIVEAVMSHAESTYMKWCSQGCVSILA
jgi:hypothetical protein